MKKLFVATALMLALGACSKNDGQTADSATPADGTNTVATPNAEASAAAAATDTKGQMLTGAGASFPQPLYVAWAHAFAENGAQINYQSIGSSGGIKQIEASTVDFGASDAPLSAEELAQKNLVQFPTVIGGVVPVINVQGLKAGDITLSGETLADIYLGKITRWNDAKIVAQNPNAKLPNTAITTVFRSDGSGTTFIFTSYLKSASKAWADGVGADKSVDWPTKNNGSAGKGNEGVATFVRQIDGAIGYVEYAYAKQNQMAHANLINQAGQTVSPSLESFAAAANVDWNDPTLAPNLINQADPKAWPITSATFVLVPKVPANSANARGVLHFFDWAYNQDQMASSLDYVPLPQIAKDAVRKNFATIKDAQGNAVFP